jgi:predicted transcriptional regulator
MSEADERALVAQILSSYLSNNTVAPADLPSVIESVKRAFAGNLELMPLESGRKILAPAVNIKKSITAEAVACLVCGRKLKSLKRHLQAAHQLTPREYRESFNLNSDYPLVAPAYATRRSELAKSLGLESVREHHAGLHSFRSMRRIEARRRKASALWLRHSQSLASRRQRPSQANVRSTIQRFGSATKPVA